MIFESIFSEFKMDLSISSCLLKIKDSSSFCLSFRWVSCINSISWRSWEMTKSFSLDSIFCLRRQLSADLIFLHCLLLRIKNFESLGFKSLRFSLSSFNRRWMSWSKSMFASWSKFWKKIRFQYHSVWKSLKKSHSILRAKRATFTFWVAKSSLKMQKMVNFDYLLLKV